MANALRTAADGPPSDGPSRGRFGVFLGGQVTSLIGDGLAILAIPLLVLDVSHSAFVSALAAAPRTIGYLLVGIPAGAIVDRVDPKAVMLVMDVVRCAVFLTLALLVVAGSPPVWLILALAFLSAGAAAFFETALTVMVRDLVTGERLVRSNSYLQMANQASLIVGPAAVGALAVTAGLQTALFVNAGTFAISFVTVLCVARTTTGSADRPAPARAPIRSELAEGFRYLRATRLILVVTCLQATANFFISVETLIVYYTRDTLGLSSATVSIVVAAGGIGGLIGAAVAGRLATPPRQVMLIGAGSAVLGMALAALGLSGSLVLLVTFNVLTSLSAVLASVAIQSLRQRVVPRALLGRVTATARVTALAAAPLGTALAGALTSLNHGDPRAIFVGAGLLAVATTAVAWRSGLRHHLRTAQPAPVVEAAGEAR
ncbi:MFS transporter [Streptomyces sp. NPDC059788]|uniref:MFS transporter n=1 Tax=Streptomyces sp. NPDC059788 TaxID=3346948 RepID=UPI0036663F61